MEAKAIARYVRVSPRKARIVVDQVRGKSVIQAREILAFTNRGVAEAVEKTLNSAVANAEHNNGMNVENLYVSTAIANPGPILKRGRIASRRGFVRINKRTTHITIGVSEKA